MDELVVKDLIDRLIEVMGIILPCHVFPQMQWENQSC